MKVKEGFDVYDELPEDMIIMEDILIEDLSSLQVVK